MECDRYKIQEIGWWLMAVSKDAKDVIGTSRELLMECMECKKFWTCNKSFEMYATLNADKDLDINNI